MSELFRTGSFQFFKNQERLITEYLENFGMKENEEEESNKENTENEYSSFRVSELLLAIERLTAGQPKPYSEQKRVEKVTKGEKVLLLTTEKQTTHQNQLTKDEKSLGNRTIGITSPKRTILIKCPPRSTFECNMTRLKMYKNPQATQKPKLQYDWLTKLDNQFDHGIKQSKKKSMVREHTPQSLSMLFSQKKMKKRRVSLDKTYPVRSSVLNSKSSSFYLHSQRSTLAGAPRHEPFIDLEDLQMKLFKKSLNKRASEMVAEKHKCVLQPIPIGRQDKEALPVPLICKGNKYIEKF
ncbi:iron-sulfur cluster assembly 1 homolog, mitochondrial isoform X1 [Mobula birostris]|uniref:iron-sulfur cluster assembly 1 homolog, mitochondrial isoform X1 n=2 Tax=Mobula birostris TaxID=1983395 RepID=UPI003B288EED